MPSCKTRSKHALEHLARPYHPETTSPPSQRSPTAPPRQPAALRAIIGCPTIRNQKHKKSTIWPKRRPRAHSSTCRLMVASPAPRRELGRGPPALRGAEPARAREGRGRWPTEDDSGALRRRPVRYFREGAGRRRDGERPSTPIAAAAAAGPRAAEDARRGGPGRPDGLLPVAVAGGPVGVRGRAGRHAGGGPAAPPPAPVVGAGGQRVADEQPGDPRRWSQYADLATKGVEERTRGRIRKVSSLWTRARGSNNRREDGAELPRGVSWENLPRRIQPSAGPAAAMLRAARTALAAFYVELARVRCWTDDQSSRRVGQPLDVAALYAEDAGGALKFPEILRSTRRGRTCEHRIQAGSRAASPRPVLVFPRFAARCRDGLGVGIVDFWRAHLGDDYRRGARRLRAGGLPPKLVKARRRCRS